MAPGPPADLARYLRAEQQLGRLRADVDPTKAAIVLLATLLGLAAAPPRAATGPAWPSIADAVGIVVDGLTTR